MCMTYWSEFYGAVISVKESFAWLWDFLKAYKMEWRGTLGAGVNILLDYILNGIGCGFRSE